MLKRIVVLCLLFGMMFGLSILTGQAEAGGLTAAASMSLASIGFTALFAFTVGEVFGAMKLPRVTGYILTGIVLGPYLSGIFSSQIVSQMKMFNQLALGLIALSAGLELDMKATLRVMKTLGVTIVLKILALLLFVGGAFVGIELMWHPFELEQNAMISVALVIATLGIGTSPAIALAILNDTRAKGPLSELLLSMAVLKDLVVVVSLAIAMAVATALLAGGDFDPHALSHVAKEIGLSVLVGAVLGVATIAYIRFVHKEMLFFVVALILGVAQISDLLHLEFLLVFIVAGFLVRNFSPYEHDLMHPLEVVALPVFVVFFTTAGANIDLGKTIAVLPVALGLGAARIIAYIVATRLGAVICRESEAIKKYSWMSYLPQAGVTLGLVTIAVGKLPQVADVLEPLGVALVALNLLVGPITLGISLKKAGEVPEGNVTPAASGEAAPASVHEAAAAPVEAPALVVEALEHDIELHVSELPLPALRRLDEELATRGDLTAIATQLDAQVEQMTLEVVDLLEQQLYALFEILPQEYSNEELATIAMQWQRQARCGESWVRERLDAMIQEQFPNLVNQLPQRVLTRLDPSQLDTSELGLRGKWRAATRSAAIRFKPSGEAAFRRVFVRQSARATLEPALLATVIDWITALSHAQVAFFGAMIGALEHPEPRERLLQTMERQIEYARTRARSAWRHGWSQALRQLATELDTLDTPREPHAVVSYARVEPLIRARLDELRRAREQWREAHRSVDAHVIARAATLTTRHDFERVMRERFIDPEHQIEEQLEATLDLVIERFTFIEAALVEAAQSEQGVALDNASLGALSEQVEQCYDVESQKKVRRLVHQHEGRQLLSELRRELEQQIARLPSDLLLLPLESMMSSQDVNGAHIDLRELFRQHILSEFFTELLREQGAGSEQISQIPTRMVEALHAVQYAIELVSRGRIPKTEGGAHLRASFSRGLKQLEEIKQDLVAGQRALSQSIEAKLEQSFAQIAAAIARPPRFDGRRFVQEGLEHPLFSSLHQRYLVARDLARHHTGRAITWIQALRERDEVRELKIRRGIEALSPRQMKHLLEEQLPAPQKLPLSPIVLQLFSLEPIDDRRLFVGREEESEVMMQAIDRWRNGERTALLVLGESGSGKSSLIDNHLFDLGSNNVYRLDRRFWYREDGILRALSFELGAREELELMARRLSRSPSVVIIDGLERWLSPDATGFAQWRKIRELISITPSTLWIVSTHDRFHHLLGELVPWEVTFTDLVRLREPSWEQLRQIIELRQRLSGFSFVYPAPGLRQRLFTRADTDDELYFQELSRRAGDDIRTALYLHLRAMSQRQDTLLIAPLQSLAIPFLDRLSPEEHAVLSSLLLFDQLSRRDLRQNLSSPSIEPFGLLRRLDLLGLIRETTSQDEVAIPLHLRRSLILELREDDLQEVAA